MDILHSRMETHSQHDCPAQSTQLFIEETKTLETQGIENGPQDGLKTNK